ncbi:MAG: hypothetical protein ABIL69_00760 [candidate division WOR-3 bacterium]
MISLIFLISSIFFVGDSTYELEPLYITASRYKLDILHTPFNVELLPKDVTSLSEQLTKIPGISLLDYGNLSTISIKGPNSKSTTVSLNDIPLNSVQSGDFDISLIPSYFIEEGYITNISLAGLHLSGNLGNTAALYIKDKEKSAFLKNGSFGKIAFGSIFGCYSMAGGFYIEKNKNRYPFKDEFNNLYYRDNAQYCHCAGYLISNSPVRINLFSTFRDADVPEKLGSIAGLPHKNEGSIVGSIFYDTKTLRIGSYGNFYALNYEDTIFGNDQHKSFFEGLDCSFKTGERDWGFYLTQEQTSSTKIGQHSRTIAGINYLQRTNIKFISILPSAKIAVANDKSYGMSIVLPFSFFFKNNLGTYHNISIGYRYPTMNELYWPEDNFSEGNPDLKNETEITIESGLRRLSSYYFKCGGFIKLGRDIIVWMPDYDGKWRPFNSAKFRAWGTDFSVSFIHPLKTSFGYSFLFARIDEGVLPYRPNHNIIFNIEKWGFFSDFVFLLKRPANASGVLFLEDIYLINTGYHLTRKVMNLLLALDLRIKNIVNKNYQFVEGYPQPGRHYEITLKINW